MREWKGSTKAKSQQQHLTSALLALHKCGLTKQKIFVVENTTKGKVLLSTYPAGENFEEEKGEIRAGSPLATRRNILMPLLTDGRLTA
jgi:hypothetical protein